MNTIDFNFNGFLSNEVAEWSKVQKFENDDSFNLCIDLNRFAQEILYKIKIHNEDPQELLASTLFLRSLEFFQGAIISIQKGMINNAKVLSRCYLEILFKLRAISISPDIVIDYIQQHDIKIKKFIKKLNNLSQKTKSKIDLSETSEKYDEIIEKIEALKIKEHGVAFYADKSKLMDLYNTAYSLFSDQVHSNVSDLESYLVIENNKVVSFNHGPIINHSEEVLNTISECMIYILEDLNIIFNLDFQEKLKYFVDKSNKITAKKIINTNTTSK